jgi:hypothetical protein
MILGTWMREHEALAAAVFVAAALALMGFFALVERRLKRQ